MSTTDITYYPTHYYNPYAYYQYYPFNPPNPAPRIPYTPPNIVINNPGVSEERLREILREELDRKKKK